MLKELSYFSINQIGIYFSAENTKLKTSMPFKDHAQFPIMVDTLIRKNNHHLFLHIDIPNKMYPIFIEAFFVYLQENHIPHELCECECIYLLFDKIDFLPSQQQKMEENIKRLQSALNNADKLIILALPDIFSFSIEDDFLLQLKNLYTHPKCRILIFGHQKELPSDQSPIHPFINIRIQQPSHHDIMAILKQQSHELEQFHHIIIPDELITQAYSLANHYLSVNDALEKTLLLLDSSAARAKSYDSIDDNKIKPILTMSTLTQVLSGWVNIPSTHLILSKFKLNIFIQNMQEQLAGQDHAINILGNELQQLQTARKKNTNTFGAFLFAGPNHVGKKTCAIAFTQQFYNQTHMLYFAQPFSSQLTTLVNMRLQRYQSHEYISLKDVLRDSPYAIIIFENIDQASTLILNELEELLCTGYLNDIRGNRYHFGHTIIILSTTCGSKRLQELSKTFSSGNKSQTIDLIQLVMNEKKQDAFTTLPFSSQEIVLEMMPEINTSLPSSLTRLLNIVPFLPLTHTSLEKIMRSKLSLLSNTLLSQHGIEFNYAPEVLKYLTENSLQQKETDRFNIDHALNHLYTTIEQAIQNQAGNKYRPSQLFLQLNETGTVLRPEWLGSAVRQHPS